MTTVASKVLCAICNKGKGTFKCEGCSKIFCPKHSIDHRNQLSKQLEEIAVDHDLAYKRLIQQTQNLQQHLLIQQVNQWEHQAIEKIRHTADEARNGLLKGITEHTGEMKRKLQDLSEELRQGREDSDFLEGDLRGWIDKLEALKLELLNPVNITVREDSTPLIRKIHIERQDTLESSRSNSSVLENGRLVMQDDSQALTEILGKNEYQIGSHTIRFRVEKLIENGWIAFGIIARKSERTPSNLCASSSSYGWSNQNQIYLSGQLTNDETIEIGQNDVVELFIDINKCPFPWQYYIDLRTTKTSVRILDPSD